MAEDKSIPADIFEEMAGMKEITPPKSAKSEENVKSERIVTPINEERLFKASIAFVSKVQKKLVKGFYKVAKRLVEIQNDAAPKMPKKQGWNIFAKIIVVQTLSRILRIAATLILGVFMNDVSITVTAALSGILLAVPGYILQLLAVPYFVNLRRFDI